MKRLSMLVAVLLVSSAAFAAAPQGFVWGDQPVNPGYSPNASYAYNSTGGAIRIARTGVGAYTVTFFGLGAAGAGHKSNVQVTAYNGRQTCNVTSWGGSPDLQVKVDCFYIPDGSKHDSQYTVLVTFTP
jgi:hypothetical protein